MAAVTFHGVRGSTPCDGHDVQRYGGNTSCVALAVPGEPPLLFDLGTGLRYFGMGQPHDGTFRASCLLSHLHWDHIQGLPFFTPLMTVGARFDVYGPRQPDGTTVEGALADAIRPPMFPVTMAEYSGLAVFHDLEESCFSIGGLRVLAREVPHRGVTLGYRVEWDGGSLAYISDHQMPVDQPFATTPGVDALIDGVDLLIHDAQYTEAVMQVKKTWGHCTVEYALWLAARGGVGSVALFHHDPVRTDAELDHVGECIAQWGSRQGITAFVARENLTVEVGAGSGAS